MVTIAFDFDHPARSLAHIAFSAVDGLRGVRLFFERPESALLTTLSTVVNVSELRPTVDSVFPLERIADAHARLEAAGVRGKIVVQVDIRRLNRGRRRGPRSATSRSGWSARGDDSHVDALGRIHAVLVGEQVDHALVRPAPSRPANRRKDALSATLITQVAIGILDDEGEEALTFRALAARLQSGAGAIYHHVANKEELVVAAAAALVSRVVDPPEGPALPDLRGFMLAVYDLIDEHVWLGGQLFWASWQHAVLSFFEQIGQRLEPLELSERSRFDVAPALVNYLLGAAGQHAAAARMSPGLDRARFLRAIAESWAGGLTDDEHPFIRLASARLADHDDRQQFAAGIDLILEGAMVQDCPGPRRPHAVAASEGGRPAAEHAEVGGVLSRCVRSR